MPYLIVGNLLFVAACAAGLWFWRAAEQKKHEESVVKMSWRVIGAVGQRIGEIGCQFGLAGTPRFLAEREIHREMLTLSGQEMHQVAGGGNEALNRRSSLREQMVDDLLRSGCLGAVPVYIEPEKLLEIFRDNHRHPEVKK